MYKLFLSPSGRIDRRPFWLTLIGFAVLVAVFNVLLRQMGNSTLAFLISLPFPFIALHMIYCIYGKRLHDMGRGFGPITGMIALEFLVIIGVMMAFGGAGYFDAFAQFDRKEDIDPAVTQAIIETYQAKLTANNHIIKPLLMLVPALFTLWVGLSKPEAKDNRYGPRPDLVAT